MRLSIRWRLTLWNMLALAGVLVGLGALVYGMSAHALYQRLDQSLQSEFRELAEHPLLTGAREKRLRYWLAELHDNENMLAVIYDARGTVRHRPEELAAQDFPPAPVLAPGERRFADVAIPRVGRQRALGSRLRIGDDDLTVLLMAPVGDVERQLRQLMAVLGSALPVALGLGGAV